MPKKNKFNLKDFYTKHPVLSNFILIICVGFILIGCLTVFLDYWTMHGSTAIVPDVRNRSYSEAVSALEANGLTIQINDSVYDRNVAPGTVLESWPKAGTVVKEGRTVYVLVTSFSPKHVTISMPLTGSVSSRQAISYLRGIGINDIRLEHVPSEYPDLVMGARFGDTPLTVGSSIPITSVVTLTVGTGPAVEEDSLFDEETEIDAQMEILSIEE